MKNRIIYNSALSLMLASLFVSCSSIPSKAKPVKDFEVNKYLGVWYEIARLNFHFEKNLDNTSAQYNLDKNGHVKVLNSGYNYKKNKWVSANGLAKFRGNTHIAALKVSFWGPFYGGYNVIALDKEYKYALIAGKSLNYLWILSREKTIPEDIKTKYLKIAQAIGYKTSHLIWVKHDKNNNPYINNEK